ncbi:hypothetical protein TNCV_3871381 [Trichonephila clavipes]|nr:hypothetical protein TNCV_3871381 [Trichonephila clavipes]
MIGKCIETKTYFGVWCVPNLGNGLWKNMWNACNRKLWPMGCHLTSRSSSIWQASAHQTLHCHDSQRWQRSQSDGHHGESCRLTSPPEELRDYQQPRELTSLSVTPPVTQECTRGITTLLREGQVEPVGPRRPHAGQRNGTTKKISKSWDCLLWPWRR